MVTTIQLNENVKSELDKIKSNKETYEQVILNLLKIADQVKRNQEGLLVEGCREMAEDMLRICNEWEGKDSDLDWEWKNEN